MRSAMGRPWREVYKAIKEKKIVEEMSRDHPCKMRFILMGSKVMRGVESLVNRTDSFFKRKK